MSESIVKQKSYEFALQIIKLCAQMRDKKHFEIASQLLRSGTSIGANVEEALAGKSKKDFFAKNVHRFERSQRNKLLAPINKRFEYS
jgi:hypothetical protein